MIAPSRALQRRSPPINALEPSRGAVRRRACAQDRPRSSASPRARPRRHLPEPSHGARGGQAHASASATSTCSWSAASSCTGDIAEMRTGEGKTLVATLPVYLNALAGKGVHVVTVNDYLAKRDAEWMGQVYRFLGMTVGVIVHGLDDSERREAYDCDITYGTNNEFGFDYLRDNMKLRAGRDGPARPQLRDRRRGRHHPDRRGAHPADHLRPDRGPLRVLQADRRADHGAHRSRRLREGREAARSPDRGRHREDRGDPARRGPAEGPALYDIAEHLAWSTTSTRRCAPTSSSSATRTTSSRTARSSSSTSSPAA